MKRLSSCLCLSSRGESNTEHVHDQEWRCSRNSDDVWLSNDERRRIAIGLVAIMVVEIVGFSALEAPGSAKEAKIKKHTTAGSHCSELALTTCNLVHIQYEELTAVIT